jgi:hypothetical protein
MSIFHRVLDRLADSIYSRQKVRLRFDVHYRIAQSVIADIERLIQDNRDGATYRCTIAHWTHAERPPLAVYQGTSSFCRIDGPLQWTEHYPFPLGGLILSPGVTAHLNPFEAEELDKRMQRAIEDTILAWVREHDLYALRPVPAEIDRQAADRTAKAMIAQWASLQRKAETIPGDICCADEAADALCKACRKGSDHG